MNGHVLEGRALSCGYSAENPVVAGLDFRLESSTATCLLGPNGVGKTTLFKTLLGFLRPLHGSVLFDGQDMRGWSRRRMGKVFGYIPQQHNPSFPFTVLEVVLMGRTPHLGGLGRIGKADERIALEALDELRMADFAGRDYTELSGGERQLVLVARVLAQRPAFLVMDEPTSALDLGNQARVLERICALAASGYGVLMTTHDPNQAFLLDGDVICMGHSGSVVGGKAAEVLDEVLLSSLYGREVRVETCSAAGGRAVKMCTPVLGGAQAAASAAQAETPSGAQQNTADQVARLRRAQAPLAIVEGEVAHVG